MGSKAAFHPVNQGANLGWNFFLLTEHFYTCFVPYICYLPYINLIKNIYTLPLSLLNTHILLLEFFVFKITCVRNKTKITIFS